jgi:hypothetical protein
VKADGEHDSTTTTMAAAAAAGGDNDGNGNGSGSDSKACGTVRSRMQLLSSVRVVASARAQFRLTTGVFDFGI